ncbi:MAG: HAMP domain-containing histidine kinase [Deltaproteobacteria bacterium]|nr:HAMP domain-containing histidine kinase [Deltaproteobacteria bacterium]
MHKEFLDVRKKLSLSILAAMLGVVLIALGARVVFLFYVEDVDSSNILGAVEPEKILEQAQYVSFGFSVLVGLAVGIVFSVIFWKKIVAILDTLFVGAAAVVKRSSLLELKWSRLEMSGVAKKHGKDDGLVSMLGRAVGLVEAEVEIVSKALSVSDFFVCAVDSKGNILYAGKTFLDTFGLVYAGAKGPNIAQVLGDVDMDVLGSSPMTVEARIGGVKKRIRAAAMKLDTIRDGFVIVFTETGKVEELRSEVRAVKRELEQRERRHEEVVDSLVGMVKILDDGEKDLKAAYNELKQAQDHLTQVSKLRALGEMSAVLAHELRQPLTVVSGLTQHLLKKEGMDADVFEKLKVIDSAARKMENVVGHLRVFMRQDNPVYKQVDLNAVIDDAFIVVGEILKKSGVEVRFEKGTLPPVIGDSTRLEQVIVNLVANARDAMPGGGEIVLATECEDGPDSRHVILSVSDTGTGMDERTVARLFEPFFTTKEPGVGTGLGLSVSRGIVREHGGNIFVDSKPGKGSVFTVKLPAAPKGGLA